jgi:hypothetical protein
MSNQEQTINKEQEEKKRRLEEEFQKKIEEMQKRDPFIYKNF